MAGLSNLCNTRQSGKKGEDEALTYLLQKGLKLVERNFHCRMGEIDLIMEDKETLVFIEVRKRNRRDFGGAMESITGTKQARLIKTAMVYLQKIKKEPSCRFDVVAIDNREITWVQNAIEFA